MLKRISKWLRHSSHVHLRTMEISTKPALVGILDRFLDDRLDYVLEWDDFISWENSDSFVEATRVKIAELEPLFMSERPDEIDRAISILVSERNRVAALCGIDQRLSTAG